jgi:hypothetical protein
MFCRVAYVWTQDWSPSFRFTSTLASKLQFKPFAISGKSLRQHELVPRNYAIPVKLGSCHFSCCDWIPGPLRKFHYRIRWLRSSGIDGLQHYWYVLLRYYDLKREKHHKRCRNSRWHILYLGLQQKLTSNRTFRLLIFLSAVRDQLHHFFVRGRP